MSQPNQPTTEYDQIYALVVRLDDDLVAGRVRYRRASDGELLTRLEMVVPAILAGDIAPGGPAVHIGPPWSPVLIPSAEVTR